MTANVPRWPPLPLSLSHGQVLTGGGPHGAGRQGDGGPGDLQVQESIDTVVKMILQLD